MTCVEGLALLVTLNPFVLPKRLAGLWLDILDPRAPTARNSRILYPIIHGTWYQATSRTIPKRNPRTPRIWFIV